MQSTLEKWCDDLDHDIALIRRIKPGALYLRLKQLRENRFVAGWWPKFALPGPGRSNCSLDRDTIFVTLDFYPKAPGQETLAQLKPLQSKFRAIKGLRGRARVIQRREHFFITFELDPRPSPTAAD